jgi:hypothetical protein
MSLTERPQRSQRDISITLQAGETRQVQQSGRTYQVISVDADGVIQIGMNQSAQIGRFLYKGMGEQIGPSEPNFTYLEFYNSDSVARALVVSTSWGNIRDSRFNPVGGAVPFQSVQPATLDTPADVVIPNTSVATLIRAAATDGYEVGIQNNGTNSIRIGGATVDGTHGLVLPSNAVFFFNTRAALYAWNNGAAAATVSLLGMRT